MENKKTLKTRAIVRKLANAIENIVDDLLANGVVTTGIVVGGILLASDQLLRVVQAFVFALSNYTKGWLVLVPANQLQTRARSFWEYI